jgi:hypothetical protein
MEMANIDTFKANASKGFARPNLFRVEIGGIKSLTMNCHTVQIPGISIATTDKDIGYRSIAYQKIYEDITLSFYCQEDMQELEYFQEWRKIIAPDNNNQVGFHDHYKEKIKIQQISKTGEDTLVTTLHEAYPKKIDQIALAYSSTSSIISGTVTITYRSYTQEFKQTPKPQPQPKPIKVLEKTGGPIYGENTKAVIRNESNNDFMKRILGQLE